ncbi:hypothetical protein EP7_004071 [Isosphaeraceae bacterium EP7]
MRRIGFSLLGTIGGYILGAVAGYVLISRASGNTHDSPVEAAMTGAFVTAPLGVIVGGVAGFLLGRRRG